MSAVELPVVPATAASIDVSALRDALHNAIAGEVRFERLDRALYSTDASVFQIVPLGVVLPKTEADIVAAMQICARFHVPLTARGGGTSQAGQCIGPGVILDCSKHFADILEINPAERWVRVRPGCVLDELNAELKPHGLQFPLDISTSNRATIGGMIANNSSGTRSVVYGKTIDHVLEVKAVLSDGSIVQTGPLTEGAWAAKCQLQTLEGSCYRAIDGLASEHADEVERRFPRILRRVGGYNLDMFTRRAERNLAHLLVGSEGTLALTLEAKLNLVPLPRARAVLVAQFHDLLDALAATPDILKHGPSAVEVVDRYVLDSTKVNAEAARLRGFLDGDPGAILVIEFSGDRADELPPRLESLLADLKQRNHGYHWLTATDAAGQGRIWKLRKLSLGLSMAEKGDAKAISFVEDTAVAPEKLRDFIAEFLEVIRKHGTSAGVYAHASVGCLHVRPIVNLKTVEGVQRFQAIADEVSDLVLKYGGALSGEHGDGLLRSPFQAKMFGPVLYEAFRTIKRTFDPQNLLNPGKIVDAPPLASNLRYGAAYVTPDVSTTFDFSVDGGIVRSAELCAGVGECRKKGEGTMCPSYQATRDEKDSTRGRANTLRLAMTGQLGMNGLTDPAVKEALDLCLECKACKSECPTNVDMARLKAEFLHQYHQKHGVPWRNWVFGNVADLAQSPFGPPNWLIQSRMGRWLGEKLLGIDRRRMAPVPATKQLWELLGEVKDTWAWPDSHPRALFFPDTFTCKFEPSLFLGAWNVLRSAGCAVSPGFDSSYRTGIDWSKEVWPARLDCCGRPRISNGLLSQAVENAEQNVFNLYHWASTGNSILACEPSCILTIKDEYPALLKGELREKAKIVAAACQTFEEFLESTLAKRDSLRSLTLPARQSMFRPGPRRILVQPHCHQRSLVGTGPLMNLLRRIPGAEVVDMEAGCCGMAGSFGYEKEHYEISRLVGEQRLFPAIRAAGPDDVIVAPGFSCRLQIKHFTGRTAVHPAELLSSLLDEPTKT